MPKDMTTNIYPNKVISHKGNQSKRVCIPVIIDRLITKRCWLTAPQKKDKCVITVTSVCGFGACEAF